MTRSEITDKDRPEIAAFIERHWHSKIVMSRGRSFYPHEENGLLERADSQIVGLITYRIENGAVEVLTHNSVRQGLGVGSALLLDAIEVARRDGCSKIWLTTTNDNLRAVAFYQRLGFRLTAVNLGVVDEARKTKPQIPQFGERGVPIHDELVMELAIQPYIES